MALGDRVIQMLARMISLLSPLTSSHSSNRSPSESLGFYFILWQMLTTFRKRIDCHLCNICALEPHRSLAPFIRCSIFWSLGISAVIACSTIMKLFLLSLGQMRAGDVGELCSRILHHTFQIFPTFSWSWEVSGTSWHIQ